jgi:ATP-dependent RNA helicase DDX27
LTFDIHTSAQPSRDKLSGLSRKAKRRKMTMEEDKELGDNKSVNAAIRSAKKAARPAKIGVPERKDSKSPKKKRKVSVRSGNTFDSDFGQKSKSREGVRSKKGDAVKLGKTGGKKGKGGRK